ncbi:Large T antigen [Dirofilaria immitis]
MKIRTFVILSLVFMPEVKPKLRRVVTFTRNNHRWSTTFDESDLRKDDESRKKDNEKVEIDSKDNSDNGSQNIPLKRSQTIR